MRWALGVLFSAIVVLYLACPLLVAGQGFQQDADSMAMELLVPDLELRHILQQVLMTGHAYDSLKLAEKVHQFNLGVGAKDICRDFFSFTPKALLEKIERGAARILEILQRAHVLIQAGGDAPQSLADAVRTGSLMLMMEQRVLISRRLQKSMALVRERCDKVK